MAADRREHVASPVAPVGTADSACAPHHRLQVDSRRLAFGQAFDHNSLLQYLAGLIGVRERNITDWRRHAYRLSARQENGSLNRV